MKFDLPRKKYGEDPEAMPASQRKTAVIDSDKSQDSSAMASLGAQVGVKVHVSLLRHLYLSIV